MFYAPATTKNSATFSPFLVKSMATPKPPPSVTKKVSALLAISFNCINIDRYR